MGDDKPNMSDLKTKLQEANKAYTECISNDFLHKFLAGENVKVEDFCQEEYRTMLDLDKVVYGSIKNEWN